MKICIILVIGVLIEVEAYTFHVTEEGGPNEVVGIINGGYRLSEPSEYFTLVDATGELKTTRRIDRESLENDVIELLVVSSSSAPPVGITVEVLDVNDNYPIFKPPAHVDVNIPESTEAGAQYFLPTATDADNATNSVSTNYSIVGGPSDKFELLVDSSPGQETLLYLVTRAKFNRENQASYSLNISATDDGQPSLTGYLSISINIQDNNDNEPAFDFTEYSAYIPENATRGAKVLTVRATDLDEGANGMVRYTINRGSDVHRLFSVDPVSGVVTLVGQLDYEVATTHRLSLEAHDGGLPVLFGRAFVTITVENVNDNDPTINFRFVPPSATIASVQDGAVSGALVALVTATDRDEPRVGLPMSITSGNELGHFRLVIVPQINIGRLQVSGVIDGSVTPRYNLTFRAGDGASPTSRFSYKSLEVVVNSPNLHPPVFSTKVHRVRISEIAPIGSYVANVAATDRDRGITGRLRYRLAQGDVNSWFRIDAQSGLITTSSRLRYQTTNHVTLIVTAQDESSTPRFANCSVEVAITDADDNPPVFVHATRTISTTEAQPPGPLITVQATDVDTVGKSIVYSISRVFDENNHVVLNDEFVINPTSGEISTTATLTRDVSRSYNLSVVASNQLSVATVVQVIVNTAVTTPPRIYPRKYFTTIQTGSYFDFILTRIHVHPRNDVAVTFRMSSAIAGVAVDRTTGDVIITGLLQQRRTIEVEIEAVSPAGVTSPATVVIVISDEQVDGGFNNPRSEFIVLENSPSGTYIGNLEADFPQISNVEYEIISGDSEGVFAINSTGALLVSGGAVVDYEANQIYNLTVVASYRVGGNVEYSTTNVIIYIHDVNDNIPEHPEVTRSSNSSTRYFDSVVFSLTTDRAVVGGFVYNATALDRDTGVNAHVTYTLLDQMDFFTIDPTGILTVRSPFDVSRETTNRVTIISCDTGAPRNCAYLQLDVVIRPRVGYDIIRSGTRTRHHVILAEDTPVNTRIFDLSTIQPPECTNPVVVGDDGSLELVSTFMLRSGNVGDLFSVFPDGQMYLKRGELDRERTDQYKLLAEVNCSRYSQLFQQEIEIVVGVSDINDNPPYFAGQLAFSIRENEPKGTYIGTVRAYDADIGIHGSIVYSLPSEGVVPFAVHPFTGEITSVATLDAENLSRMFNVTNNTFALTVRATDNNGSHVTDVPTHSSDVTIEIKVDDVNEFPPSCRRRLYRGEVAENSANGTRVIQITSHDMDYEDGGFEYSISPPDVAFVIDPHTGWIIVSNSARLNIEEKKIHELVVDVSDTTGSSGRCVVEVQLIGVNENPPIFQPSSLTWLVPESAPLHSEIGRLRATDYDVGDINNEVTYALSPSNDPEIRRTFVVEASSGRIILTRSLDRETIGSYDVIVTSQDSDPVLPMTSTATCSVIIKDANDNRPRFVGSMEFHVTEGYYATATNIGAMATTDDDVGANGIVTYRIVGHGGGGEVEVGIDPNSGRLSVGGRLDREQFLPDGLFRITVVATDSATHPVDRMSAVGVVNIVVDDVNDRSPVFTSPDTFLLPTRMMDDARTVVASLHAADDDAGNNGDVIYSVTSSARFTLNPNSGSLLLSGDTPATGLLEQIDVTASDKGTPPQSTTLKLNIIIGEIGLDNGPVFDRASHAGSILENTAVGTEVLTIVATGNQVGYYIISCTTNTGLSRRAFVIDPTNGVISSLLMIDREDGVTSYTLQVVAVDMTSHVNNPRVTSTNVVITVLDFNDNAPLFQQSFVEVFVSETTSPGDVISTASARDVDQSQSISYSLRPITGSEDFRIDPRSAEVTVGPSGLDRERRAIYTLHVIASDGLHESELELLVHILDVDDNPPVFSQPQYMFSMVEGSSTPPAGGRYVGSIMTSDPDISSEISYNFVNGSDRGRFLLDENTGSIQLNPVYTGLFDREVQDLYSFIVRAVDTGGHTVEARVFVEIENINDNPPVFQLCPPRVVVSEGVDVGQYVTTIQANDADIGLNGIVEYYIVSGDASGQFKIAPDTGVVTVQRPLDHEIQPQFNLVVMATDAAPISSRHRSYCDIIIEVSDINDHAPQLLSPPTLYMPESSPAGTNIGTLGAYDQDESTTGVIYTLMSQSPDDSTFILNQTSGLLSLRADISTIEITDRYNLTIQVEDTGSDIMMSSTQRIEVIVTDVNNNAPLFSLPPSGYMTQVMEGESPGSIVLRVGAVDGDDGLNGRVGYYMVGGSHPMFAVDQHTGSINLVGELDFERNVQHMFGIMACDRGVPRMCDITNVTVVVVDVNDESPVISPASISVNIKEGQSDMQITQLTASDKDTGLGGIVDFRSVIVTSASRDGSPTTPPSGVSFTISSTGIVTLTQALDREEASQYTLDVIAVDRGTPSLTSTGSILIIVGDVNEFTPVFQPQSYWVNISENAGVGAEVTQVSAVDHDAGEFGVVRYELLEDFTPFVVDPSTGIISVSRGLDREMHGRFTLHVVASDHEDTNLRRSSTAEVIVVLDDVNDNQPMFDQPVYDFYVHSSGGHCGVVHASDRDSGANGEVVYTVESTLFHIDPHSGMLTASSPLTSNLFNLTVYAADRGEPRLTSHANVEIRTHNINRPIFISKPNTPVSLVETTSPGGAIIAAFRADTSRDSGRDMEYYISGDNGDCFVINRTTGEVRLNKVLDFEKKTSFQLWVEARDSGTPPVSAFTNLTINVEDANDNPPRFTHNLYVGHVIESTPSSTITRVSAWDPDTMGGVTYSMVSGGDSHLFELHPVGGTIRNRSPLNRELRQSYFLTVEATDGLHSSTTGVKIIVDDINDNAPRFTKLFTATVREDAEIGDYIIQVTSTDMDSAENSRNRYELSDSGNDAFTIHPTTGWLRLNKHLDAEVRLRYELQVIVGDSLFRPHTSIHIGVTNVNDNPPRFSEDHQEVNVADGTNSGSLIVSLSATDADGGDNIRYAVETPTEFFRIDQRSGEVYATQKLTCNSTPDLEDSCPQHHVIEISASDPSLSSSTSITIHIRPPNIHPPIFQSPPSTLALLRTSPVGTKAAEVLATDKDPRSAISYHIMGPHVAYFHINQTSGVVTTIQPIDFGLGTKLRVNVQASDDGLPTKHNVMDLEFEIAQTNSDSPQFRRHLFTAPSVPEDSPVGHQVFVVEATDADPGINGQVVYSFDDDADSMKPFSIDDVTGAIVISSPLDYESVQSYSLVIIATDRSVSPRSSHVTLIVPIGDVDDNPPVFNASCYVGYANEGLPPGSVITRLTASDADTGENSVVQYSVHPPTTILVRSLTGEVYTAPSAMLDYEAQDTYHLNITAESTSKIGSSTSLIIRVTGVNEFPPRLIHNTLNVVSSVAGTRGKVVGRLNGTDMDRGQDGEIYFYLSGWSEGLGFVVDAVSGDIMVGGDAGFNLGETIQLTVFAKNPGLSLPSGIVEATVVVSIVTNECMRSPCLNGARCEDGADTFACICPPGYTGVDCGVEVNECQPDPCMNGGVCVDMIAGFMCTCPLGYTGGRCEVDVDYCQSGPCRNGAPCIDGDTTYSCVCTFGTTGRDCEVTSLGFEALSYLTSPTLNHQYNMISMEFATVSTSALLMYNHGGGSNTYVALEILQGMLRLSYSFTSARIYRHDIGRLLNDGQWHSVTFTLGQSGASVNIDNCDVIRDVAGDCSVTISHNGVQQTPLSGLSPQPLNIGGVPSIDDITNHPGQISSWDFVGCMRSIVVNSVAVDLMSSNLASSGVTVGCTRANSATGGGCAADSCMDGQCSDAWSEIICDCPLHKSGQHCQDQQIGTTFSGGGHLTYTFQPLHIRESLLVTSSALLQPTRRKRNTQTEVSSIEVSFRTRRSGLLLLVQSPSQDFIALFVDDDHLFFQRSVHGMAARRELGTSLTDGKWHDVRIAITAVADSANFNISVDNRNKLYESFIGGITRLTDPSQVERIELGGSATVVSPSIGSLDGCLLYFALDGRQQPLAGDVTSSLLVLEQSSLSSFVSHGCPGNDVCSSNPCALDEFCRDIWEAHECIPIGACSSSPCLNHATCVPYKNGSYECACPTYYMGNLCETYIPCLVLDCSLQGSNLVCAPGAAAGETVCACAEGHIELDGSCVRVAAIAGSSVTWWVYVIIAIVGLLVFAVAIWCVRRHYNKPGRKNKPVTNGKSPGNSNKPNGNNGQPNTSFEFDTITRSTLPRPDILPEDVDIVDEEPMGNNDQHNDYYDVLTTPQKPDMNGNLRREDELSKRASPLPSYAIVMKQRATSTLPPMYESERESGVELGSGVGMGMGPVVGVKVGYKTSPPLSVVTSSIGRPSPTSSPTSGASPPPRIARGKKFSQPVTPTRYISSDSRRAPTPSSRPRRISGSAASSTTTTTSSLTRDVMPPTTIEDMVQHLNGLVGLTREEIDLLNEPPGKSPSYPSSTTGSVMSSYPPSVEPQRSRKPSALFHHERSDRPSSLPGRRIDRILPSGRSRTPMMLSSSYAANLPPDLRPSQLLQPPPDTSSDEEEEDSRSNIREEYLPNMEDVMRLGPMKYEAMAAMFADLSELPSIDETSTDVMIAANRKWSASSSSSSQSKPRISSSSASSASGSRATPTGRARTRHEHYV